jgi:hypothetical protein
MMSKNNSVDYAAILKSKTLADTGEIKAEMLRPLSDPAPTDFNLDSVPNTSQDRLNASAARIRERGKAAAAAKLKRDERNDRTWVNDLDMGSVTGATTNIANRVLQSGAIVAGNFGSAPDNTKANRVLRLIGDDARDVLNRQKSATEKQKFLNENNNKITKALLNGSISPADAQREKELLISTVGEIPIVTQEEAAALDKKVDIQSYAGSDKTRMAKKPILVSQREAYAIVEKELAEGKETKDYFAEDTFITKGFNDSNRTDLNEQFDTVFDNAVGEFDNAKGLAETTLALLKGTKNTLGALADNKLAAAEYAAESSVNTLTAVNPFTAAANTVAFSSDVLGNNLRNADEIVSEDKQNELVNEAMLGGGLEYVSNAVTGGAAGLIKKSTEGVIKETTKGVSRTLAEQTALRGLKVTGASAAEVPVEMAQTAIENDAFGQDFNFEEDARDVFKAGAIGFGSSAALTTPGTIVGQLKDTGSAIAKKALNKQAEFEKASTETVAARTGAVDSLITSKDYTAFVENPTRADDKKSKFDLSGKLSTIAARHEELVNSDKPDTAKSAELLSVYGNVMAAALDKNKALKTEAKTITDEFAVLKEKGEKPTLEKANRLKEINAEVKELTEDLAIGDELYSAVQNNQETVVNTAESVDQLVKATDRDEKFEVNAQRILETNTTTPEAITVEQMESMLKSDKWTAQERELLTSTLTAKISRQAVSNSSQSSTTDVLGEVLKGSAKNKGADQYRVQIATALKNGDTATALSTLNQLKAFSARHSAKADDFKKAFAFFERKQAQGSDMGKMTRAEYKAIAYVQDINNYQTKQNKKYTMRPQLGGSISNMQFEAKALNDSVKEMEVLFKNKSLLTTIPVVPQATQPVEPTTSADTSTEAVTETPTSTESTVTPTAATTPTETVTQEANVAETETTPTQTTETAPEPTVSSEQAAPVATESADTSITTPTETNTDNTTATDEVTSDSTETNNDDGNSGTIDVEPVPVETEESVTVQELRNKTSLASKTLADEQKKLKSVEALARMNLGLSPDNKTKESAAELKKEKSAITKQIRDNIKTLKKDVLAARKNLQDALGVQKDYSIGQFLIDLYPGSVIEKAFISKPVRGVIGSIPNAVQAIKQLPEIVLGYLDTNTSLNDQQRLAIKSFTDFAERFGEHLDNIVWDETDSAFFNQSLYMNFTQDGKLTQAAKDVMAATAYNWLAFTASETMLSTYDNVARSFGIDKNAVGSPLYNLIRNEGVSMSYLAESLGAEAVSNLGLGLNRETAGDVQIGELKANVGAFIIGGLLEGDLIKQSEVSNQTIASVRGQDASAVDKRSTTRFIKLKETAKAVPRQYVTDIIEVNRKTDRIIAKMTESTVTATSPSIKPIDADKSTTVQKNTIRKLAKSIQEYVVKAQAKQWGIREKTDEVFNFLTEEGKDRVTGIVGDDALADMPKDMRESAEAKNLNLLRERENYEDWGNSLSRMANGILTPFYFAYEVWKNQRIAISNTQINPQTSKFQRGMVGLKAWERKVELSNAIDMELFQVAIAQGLGIAVDKMTVGSAVKRFQHLVYGSDLTDIDGNVFLDSEGNPEKSQYNEVFVAAVTGINELRTGAELSTDQRQIHQENIAKAVEAGKENTHTLHALTNLANMQLAADNGTATFDADIWVEIDGITNGVAIGLAQFGNGDLASLQAMMASAGVFSDGSRSYGEYKERGGLDMYERLGNNWGAALKTLLTSGIKGTPRQIKAMQIKAAYISSFLGDLSDSKVARKLSKPPLLTNVYGSGGDSLLSSLGDTFFKNVEEQIFKIINNKETDNVTKNAELKTLNDKLVVLNNGKAVYKLTNDPRSILEQRIPVFKQENIRSNISDIHGKTLMESIDITFGGFKRNRSKVNAAMNGINQPWEKRAGLNTVFIAALQSRIESRITELVADGSMDDRNIKGFPQKEMDAVLDELQAIIPGIKTSFSTETNEQIQVAKQEKVRGKDVFARTLFGKPIKALEREVKNRETGEMEVATSNSSLNPSISSYTFKVEMGVGMPIINIHSLDGTLAVEMVGDFDVLGVHDGFPSSFLDAIKHGKHLNKRFIEEMGNRNPYVETVAYMRKAIESLQSMEAEGKLKVNPQHIKDLEKSMGVLTELHKNTKKVREEFLKNVEYVTQYNFEDAGYETENGAAKRVARAERAEAGLSEQPTATPPVVTPNVTPVEKAAPTSQWGALADLNQSKTPFQSIFEKAAMTTNSAKEVFSAVFKDREVATSQSAVITGLLELIPNDLELVIIDADFAGTGDTALDTEIKNSHGAFVLGTDSKTIYLKSSQFTNTGVNLETASHELVHALTVDVINGVNDGTITKPVTVKTVREIEKLFDAVKSKLEGRIPDSRPLENIKEFIAYGMTNQVFQGYLNKIKFKTPSRFLSAMQSFVELVNKALFGKTDIRKNTALQALITNVANLAYDQSKIEKRNSTQTDTSFQRIRQMTVQQILAALKPGDQTPEHTAHILGLNENIVSAIGGANGVNLDNAETELGDTVDQFLNGIATNKRPFVAEMKRLFKMSEQEQFVADQLEAIFDSALDKQSFDNNRMIALWKHAKSQMTWEDFLDNDMQKGDPAAEALAKQRYKYVFVAQTNKATSAMDAEAGGVVMSNKSNYVQRFAVLASVSEPFRSKLAGFTPTETASVSDNSFIKSISEVMGKLFARLRELFESTVSLDGNTQARMDTLLGHIASTTQKKRNKLVDLTEKGDKFNQKLNGAGEKILRTAFGLLDVRKLKDSNIPFVSSIAVTGAIIAQDRSNILVDTIHKYRDSIQESRHGILTGLIHEASGITENNSRFVKLLRWANRDGEQKRKQIKTFVTDIVKQSFANKEISHHALESITKALVMTDVGSLLSSDKYSLADIIEMYTDNTVLQSEITKLENQLKDTKSSTYYVNQADALGYYMTTGIGTNNALSKNAFNIARMFGQTQSPESNANDIAAIVDTLASLRAMTYVDQGTINSLLETAKDEMNRVDGGNGLELSVLQHNVLKQEALDANFDGDPTQMSKGFISEVTNPRITMKWAQEGSMEARNLLRQGYVLNKTIPRDRNIDPEKQESSLYTIEDGGMTGYLTGIISMTSKAAKGTGFVEAGTQVDNHNLSPNFSSELKRMVQKVEKDNVNLHTRRIHPSTVKDNKLIPQYNMDGKIIDFRYEMKEEDRKTVIEKNYDVSQVLGTLASSVVDKESTTIINNKTVDALYDQYSADTLKNKANYLEISAESTDPEIRELWAMLPYELRKTAGRKFGNPRIMVKKELANLVFGYRKKSVRNLWNDDLKNVRVSDAVSNREYGKASQVLLRNTLEMALGKSFGVNVAMRVGQAEDVMQELVSMVKDIFVVKNVFTTMANVVSNTALLKWSGVPSLHIARDTMIAWNGANRWNDDTKKLFELQNTMAVYKLGSVKMAEVTSEIAEIEQRLAVNPVKKLMDAGMFQTIVEDIDSDIDPYSYKSKFLKELDEKVGRNIPKGYKTFGKELFITQDSKLYGLLNNPIQMSDFSARYVQYKYLTETQSNPLSAEQAIVQITENFINYDIPTGRALQYLNDMGLIMFTKYFIRIQKPILRLFLTKPANGLLMLLLQDMFGFATPADSLMGLNMNPANKLSNPLFTMFGAPDEIATLNLLLHGTGIK